LQSYYDILGISKSAGNAEIKSAFRRMAKLYHPDKNPNGKDQFEVLIDTARRSQYDLKLKHGTAAGYTGKKTNTKQKEWNFSDEELKRRQYYKEHYKKEYERYSKTTHVPQKTYNEYKYILFAAPIAVGLFMFIINSYEKTKAVEEKKERSAAVEVKKDELKMTDDPFTAYFKRPVYDIDANRALVIKNSSSKDVIVALFDEKNKFLRSSVIKSGFYIEVSQLPGKEMNLRLITGKRWSRSKEHKDLNVIGGFTENESYHTLNTRETNGYSITLDDPAISALEDITEKEFFKQN
jgi:curved DNA-binding protein CbpA